MIIELARRNVPGFAGQGTATGLQLWLLVFLFFLLFIWLFSKVISDFDRNFDLPEFPGSPLGPGLILGLKVLAVSGLMLFLVTSVLEKPAASPVPFYLTAFVISPLVISALVVFFLRRDSKLINPAREILADYWPEFLLIFFFTHVWQSLYYVLFNIRFSGVSASLVTLGGLFALCVGAGYIALAEAVRPTVETLEG